MAEDSTGLGEEWDPARGVVGRTSLGKPSSMLGL